MLGLPAFSVLILSLLTPPQLGAAEAPDRGPRAVLPKSRLLDGRCPSRWPVSRRDGASESGDSALAWLSKGRSGSATVVRDLVPAFDLNPSPIEFEFMFIK